MPISKDQARDIAKAFLDASHGLGAYRFANWGALTPAQRRDIEDSEWTLLNYSSDFITTAVGIALDDMQSDLKAIQDATAKANKVIDTIKTVKDVLNVVAAVAVLGGAIASQSPGAIASAAKDLYKKAKDALDK